MLKKQPDVASFCQHVQFGTAFASGVRYLQSMLKPPNDTRYLAVIRRLCESAEKEHIETAHLIERLVAEPRYVASAVATPSSKPRPRRTRRPRWPALPLVERKAGVAGGCSMDTRTRQRTRNHL